MAFNSSFSSVHKVKSLDRKAALQLGDLILPTYASKQMETSSTGSIPQSSGWEPVFAGGFDSVAQISIDETWTGFRFRPKHLVGKRPR
jgi:hypothetical protein